MDSTLCNRSYLAPVRDEEAESQRKAKSRLARQTRRSTQVKRKRNLRDVCFFIGWLTVVELLFKCPAGCDFDRSEGG